MILTSAGSSEPYKTDDSGQINFSRRLFSKLLAGDSVKSAFDYARNQQLNMGYPSPRLEDNGDGIDNTTDGLLASTLHLNGELTWGTKPTVGTITVRQILEGASSTPLAVEVTKGDVNIERVWAQIVAPNANITGADATISYPELMLTRNGSTGLYEGTLTNLTANGIYKVVVTAMDVNKERADPGLAYITVAAMPGDIDGNGAVSVDDTIMLLQVLSGQPSAGLSSSTGADVDGDGKLGLPEAIYILQKAAGVR